MAKQRAAGTQPICLSDGGFTPRLGTPEEVPNWENKMYCIRLFQSTTGALKNWWVRGARNRGRLNLIIIG